MKYTKSIYSARHFPPDVIAHTVWLYHRFTLSLRDVEELLASRGISVSYETIRVWSTKFGPIFARRLRKHHGKSGDIWHMDEVQFVTTRGERCYL